MLLEKKVSAFSTWEKELPKFIADTRYKILTMKERRPAFDKYVLRTRTLVEVVLVMVVVFVVFVAIVDDDGFTSCGLLHLHRFLRGRVEEERNEKRRQLADIKKAFTDFLAETVTSPNVTFGEFTDKHKHDDRYKVGLDGIVVRLDVLVIVVVVVVMDVIVMVKHGVFTTAYGARGVVGFGYCVSTLFQ